MKTICALVALCTSLLQPASLHAQSLAATRMNAMGKGFNLANWLEAGWLGSAYPNPTEYTRAELEALARMGFRTMRVPVLFEWGIRSTAPYDSITDNGPFAIIDSVIVPVAEKYRMVVIFDNHHGHDLTDSSYASDIPRLCGMWAFLTQRYRALPHDWYFFELRNEPTYQITNEHLHTVQQAVIDSIRARDADRTLIAGANWWNAGESLAASVPYRDASDNIIYTFHNYDPFSFTHQGFSWSGVPLGATFAYPGADADAIFSVFADVRKWADTHAVPVFLGEFGASWFADADSRCRYIHCLMDACDSMRFPWLYWDVTHAEDAFGIFRSGVVRADSLIPCFRAAMNIATGVEAPTALPDASTAIYLYPNPAFDRVWVSGAVPFQGATVAVYDARGTRMLVRNGVWGAALLDVSLLPAGAYWVLVQQGRMTRSEYFMRR